MLNALANHGYIARDGRDISLLDLQTGFNESVHFVADILVVVGNVALTLSTTKNQSTFDLIDLAAHNVIEHDASLSRNDAYFGDDLHFNPSIWAAVATHFSEETIPIATAARARLDRLAAAQSVNPNFDLTASGAQGSLIETALYQIVLGDLQYGNPPTEWVNIFFGEYS